MNSQPNQFPPYPQAAQGNYTFSSYEYPAIREYHYPGTQQQQVQQNQLPYSFGSQQPNTQQLQPQTHSTLTPQPQQQQRNPPPPQIQQAQRQQTQQQQQQVQPQQPRQNAQSSPMPSPGAGPGASAADLASAEAELERQLMDALNNDTEDAQQIMAQLYPNTGDAEQPIYRMPPPPERTYPSEEELDKAMHDWSLAHGYELVRRACKKNARGEQYKRYYDCSQHGRKRSKLLPEERKRKSKKPEYSECPMSVATVAVDPANPTGEWQIRHRKTHHNHPAQEGKQMAGHRRRYRDPNVQRAIDGLFAIGTSTSQVVQFLTRTNPGGLFTRTDVANMKLKWNKFGTCTGQPVEGEPRSKAAFKASGGACHMCRAKHDACEGTRPTCSNCKRRGTDCVYDPLRPSQVFMHGVPGRSTSQIDLTLDTPTSQPQQQPAEQQQQQTQPQPTPTPITVPAPPKRGRGRPPKITQPTLDASSANKILEDLRGFQEKNFAPTRLELKSSAVEYLAQTTCGNGDSYKFLPMLSSQNEWQTFRNELIVACMKENTHDVLVGTKTEPQRPPVPAGTIGKAEEIESWNEYIKQLAIYRRRNEMLVAAIWQHLTQYYRNRIHNVTKASAVWSILEDTFQPRGCEMAFRLFFDLQSTTLATSNDLKDYIHRLESIYERFKQLPLNTTLDLAGGVGISGGAGGGSRLSQSLPREGRQALPEEMVCLLFLQNLGPEWRRWVDGLCATNNIGGFGTGERLGLRELCKRVVAYEAMQRRELGRS